MAIAKHQIELLERSYKKPHQADDLKAQNAEEIISRFKIKDEHKALAVIATNVLSNILEASYAERLRPHTVEVAAAVENWLRSTVNSEGIAFEDYYGQFICKVSPLGEILSSDFKHYDELAEEKEEEEWRNPYALSTREYAINSLREAVRAANSSLIFDQLGIQLTLDEETLIIGATGPMTKSSRHRQAR